MKSLLLSAVVLTSLVFANDNQEVAAASKKGTSSSCAPAPCAPAKPARNCCPATLHLVPAYNHAANITTMCSWNVMADASFIYWEAMQDNMEVGVLEHETGGDFSGGKYMSGTNIKTDTQFRPGFKVGAGVQFDYDHWDLHAEYTWFRSETNQSTSVPSLPSSATDYYAIWGTLGSGEILTGPRFTSLHSTWHVNMDIVDAVLGRSYYVGKKLTYHPYAGLRSAFIRQKQHVAYKNASAVLTFEDITENVDVFQNSNSWSVGPEFGIDLNWTVYDGLRVITSLEADLLYTNYNRLHNSTNTSPLDTETGVANTETNLGCVRAHTDMELGIGYGLFFSNHQYYVDFSATYGFQAFFDQNMFHYWSGGTVNRKGLSSIGNLYIQGLTVAVDFHF